MNVFIYKGLTTVNHFLILISSLFIIQTLQAKVRTESITAKQETKVLMLLNNFCGDSWCEGSYDIHFKAIEFTPNDEIYILASATPMDSNYDSKTSSVALHCQIVEPSIIMDTLTAKENEQLYEAEQRLYEAVSDCIDSALYSKPI